MWIDTNKLKKIIQNEIEKRHKLGEFAGGSGHLSYRSVSKLELETPKEIKFKGKIAYQIAFKFNIYTETEFLHSPEDNDTYFTERHQVKVIFDKNINILEWESQK